MAVPMLAGSREWDSADRAEEFSRRLYVPVANSATRKTMSTSTISATSTEIRRARSESWACCSIENAVQVTIAAVSSDPNLARRGGRGVGAGRCRVLAAGRRRARLGGGAAWGPITTESRGSLRARALPKAPRRSGRDRWCATATSLRNTGFAGGRAAAFIDGDGIFVAPPMWDLAHAVWQFAPVCGDADRWLEGWPSAPDRSARIAASVGGYGLGAGRADELADMVAEVIAGCRRAAVHKIAAGIAAFVQMEREGLLATLDSQHRAAEQPRPLIAHAAAAASGMSWVWLRCWLVSCHEHVCCRVGAERSGPRGSGACGVVGGLDGARCASGPCAAVGGAGGP